MLTINHIEYYITYKLYHLNLPILFTTALFPFNIDLVISNLI